MILLLEFERVNCDIVFIFCAVIQLFLHLFSARFVEYMTCQSIKLNGLVCFYQGMISAPLFSPQSSRVSYVTS